MARASRDGSSDRPPIPENADGRPADKAGGEAARAEGLEARRRRLETDLASRRPTAGDGDDDGSARRKGYAHAVKLSSEFIAGVAVGAALGYGIDRLFGTSPWGMIVMLLLGFGAGVLNVMRSAGVVAEPRPGRRSKMD